MPTPDERQPAASLPLGGQLELVVTQLDAGQVVGVGGMRLGQADRHVHVVDVRGERAPEDRHQEARVDGVHDQVDAVGARERLDGGRVRGVDALGRVARRVADLSLHAARPVEVVVGEHHLLQPRTAAAQLGDGLPDRADADQQDLHEAHTPSCRLPACAGRPPVLSTGRPVRRDAMVAHR